MENLIEKNLAHAESDEGHAQISARFAHETDKKIDCRAKAWTGQGVTDISAMVDLDGTVRVWDSVAGYYTMCHSLSVSALRRIRKMVS